MPWYLWLCFATEETIMFFVPRSLKIFPICTSFYGDSWFAFVSFVYLLFFVVSYDVSLVVLLFISGAFAYLLIATCIWIKFIFTGQIWRTFVRAWKLFATAWWWTLIGFVVWIQTRAAGDFWFIFIRLLVNIIRLQVKCIIIMRSLKRHFTIVILKMCYLTFSYSNCNILQ